jgi:hypothetical protein
VYLDLVLVMGHFHKNCIRSELNCKCFEIDAMDDFIVFSNN